MSPTLRVLGRRVPAMMRIGSAGELIGLPSRTTAYRVAESDDWPCVGPPTSRYVVMCALLDRIGIPYEVETEEADDEGL
jgi:hypothetical protein